MCYLASETWELLSSCNFSAELLFGKPAKSQHFFQVSNGFISFSNSNVSFAALRKRRGIHALLYRTIHNTKYMSFKELKPDVLETRRARTYEQLGEMCNCTQISLQYFQPFCTFKGSAWHLQISQAHTEMWWLDLHRCSCSLPIGLGSQPLGKTDTKEKTRSYRRGRNWFKVYPIYVDEFKGLQHSQNMLSFFFNRDLTIHLL